MSVNGKKIPGIKMTNFWCAVDFCVLSFTDADVLRKAKSGATALRGMRICEPT